MTAEELTEAANHYAECQNGGSKGSGIIQESYKAGWNDRDSLVEAEKKEAVSDYKNNLKVLLKNTKRHSHNEQQRMLNMAIDSLITHLEDK